MPFLDIRNDMLLSGLPGSGGPTSGLGENFSAAYEDQSRNNALFGLEAQVEEDYLANQALVQRLTGEAPRAYPLAVYTSAARAAEGADPAGAWQRLRSGGEGFADPDQRRMWEDFSAHERRLAELKKQHPEVKTFAEVWSDVRARSQDVERNAEDAWRRAGVLGVLGGFAGRVAGSFTWRDPVNIGTLGLGGAGRSAAVRILTEAGANAGVETVDQFSGVQESRRLLGLSEQSPWESILFAGAGAGVFRGAAEGAGPGFRALEAKISPNRAAARVISGEIERGLGQPLGGLLAKSGLSDEQLLSFLRAQPQTAEVRGALHALEEEADTLRANPFGDGREADVLHGQRVRQAFEMIDGRIDGGSLAGSTAMARVLDAPGGPRVVMPDAALHDLQRMEVERLARDAAPEVFRRMDEANARLSDIEATAAQIQDALEARRIGDAVAAFDEPTGLRMKQIEAELEGSVPASRRQDLERELDMLSANLPMDRIAAKEQMFRRETERQFRYEAGRKAAKRELRQATKEAEAVVQRVVSQQAQRAVAANMAGRQEAALARDATAVGLRRMAPAERYGAVPAKEQTDRLVEVIDEAAQSQDDLGKAVVARARAPAEATAEGPQKVDIGLDDLVPEEFAVPVAAVDVGGRRGVRVMTVRQILDDLAEDEKLVQQMKVCSI